MLIGQLSARTGVSRDTIRYYESLGLLKAQGRSRSGAYKLYDAACTARLHDIARLKRAGFTMREIRQLVNGPAACRDLPAVVRDKITLIDRRLEELQTYRTSLVQIGNACDETCGTTRGLPDCVQPASCTTRP
jgi:DNA-binding transcriptional MerR regulator